MVINIVENSRRSVAQVDDRAALRRMFNNGVRYLIVRDETDVIYTYKHLNEAATSRELDDPRCRALDLDVMLHPERY